MESLAPDIAVVPECASPEILHAKSPEFEFSDVDWIGPHDHKGLGVFAFNGTSLIRHSTFDGRHQKYLPLTVMPAVGHSFPLLAVWAFNRRVSAESFRSEHPTESAFKHYWPFVAGDNAIVAGDFNNSTVWDRPGKENNFGLLVERLRTCGLVSAYHNQTSQECGSESVPTHFFRKSEVEYHIDYCFVPDTAMINGVTMATENLG